jgi:hypothetical protein
MLTFRTGENPCLRFIARPCLPQNPKRFIIAAFRALDTRLRKNIDLLFQDDSLFLFLLFDDDSTTAFLLCRPTTVTDEHVSLWKHQNLTFRAKLHDEPS